MKYVKKFETLQSADGYVIPNPFIGHVENGQIIANNEDGKKLEVEGGGIIIVNAVTLISFTIDGTTYQAEQGMTWGQWKDSEYNTNNYTIINEHYIGKRSGSRFRYIQNAHTLNYIYASDIITNDMTYILSEQQSPH